MKLSFYQDTSCDTGLLPTHTEDEKGDLLEDFPDQVASPE